MGKVRPERVRRMAQELIDQNPGKFTTDFENNKKVVEDLTAIPSKRLKNVVAGYITRLVSIAQASEEAEVTESEEPE